jgi:uncharacterized membrane protein YbhN (UPF0104 family)
VALGVEAPGALPLALGAAALAGAAAALWVLVATPLGRGAREWLARRLGGRGGDRLRNAFMLADRVRPRHATLWAAGYAASWLVLGAAFLLFVGAFHPAAAVAPRYIAGTVAAAYLVGYLFVFVPAGIGVREGAMLLLLQQVMPEIGAALVVSVLSRIWFTAAELVPLALLPAMRTGTMAEERPG